MNHISQAQSIGQLLRQQRKAMGYTQDQVAQSLDVRRQTIADLENGKNVGSHLLLGALAYLGLNFDTASTKPYQKSIHH
ncbi:MAG: helix-turn-helix domain-containing protein, partial [Polynucleobacter victoriensis]